MPYTQEQLNSFVDKEFEYATEMLNKNGMLHPMFGMEYTEVNGKVGKLAVLLVGDNQSMITAFTRGLGLCFGALKKLNKLDTVSHVWLLGEAWFTHIAAADKGMVLRPTVDPARREMLRVAALTADGLSSLKSMEMFTAEVKGKKHFSLMPMPTDRQENADADLLENFFTGYARTQDDNDPRNNPLKAMAANVAGMQHLDFDRALTIMVEALSKIVGGKSEMFTPGELKK